MFFCYSLYINEIKIDESSCTVVMKIIEPLQCFGFYQIVILYNLSSFGEIYRLCYALAEVLLH